MTLSLIRQHYWIPDERSTVRREIKRCIECCRFNSKPSYTKMGDLPKQRITQTRPFEIVGIDFAGPILTKCQHLRKANKFKSYICLFICLATKAVHLELVSTLSTDAMLAALRRFIARRGHPSEIHSDNGTNFIGANNYLKQLYMLKRASILDPWSLPPSSDPADMRTPTPGHFLFGEPLLEIPESTDGSHRVAILQTGAGLTRRSINKIVVLPICARKDGESEIHH
ncbi:integrase catalytic domain-containing protein [Trichonephila clavipes]|nr:integrase catalytic domain-containing protein [Trichonephila clavipes]